MKAMYDIEINRDSVVSEIIDKNCRTAAILAKYGVPYCSDIDRPLHVLCKDRGLDTEKVLREILNTIRSVRMPVYNSYHDWQIDFLTDFIVNVHHNFLRYQLPLLEAVLYPFVEEKKKVITGLEDLKKLFRKMSAELIDHIDQEEEIIFPYIRQIAHAYNSSESFGSLLVRTLRKPVENIMDNEQDVLVKYFYRLRSLTNDYSFSPDACTGQRMVYSLLKDLDEDVVQHMYLESSILFPRAIAMEKELLART